MRSFKIFAVVAALGGVLFAFADQAIAAHGNASYRDVVLADNPAVYYEFNETVGATQVFDTTNNLNSDGSTRDSQFVGQRTSDVNGRVRANDPGFDLLPGTNVIFGGLGPVGTVVEFNDPTPAFQSNDQGNPNPGAEGNGGYIETGLHKNFGPNGGDYSFEFLYRDNEILSGRNRTESIVSQGRVDDLDLRANFEPFVTPSGVTVEQVHIVGTSFIEFDPYNLDPSVPFADFRGTPNIGIAANNAGESDPGSFTSFTGNGDFNGGTSSSGFVPVQGKWQHVVQTFEQGGGPNGRGLIRWFIDGIEQASSQIVGDTGSVFTTKFFDNDAPIILGASGGESFFHPRFYYDGFLDEFAVYDFRLDDPNGDGDTSDSRIPAHADAFAAALASFNDADFDFDDDVDGADFLAWQRAVGPDEVIVGNDGFVNLIDFQASAGGDANGDDLTDGADLAIWAGQFGTTAALAASTGVPEPSTGLLAGGLLALASLARRRVVASC